MNQILFSKCSFFNMIFLVVFLGSHEIVFSDDQVDSKSFEQKIQAETKNTESKSIELEKIAVKKLVLLIKLLQKLESDGSYDNTIDRNKKNSKFVDIVVEYGQHIKNHIVNDCISIDDIEIPDKYKGSFLFADQSILMSIRYISEWNRDIRRDVMGLMEMRASKRIELNMENIPVAELKNLHALLYVTELLAPVPVQRLTDDQKTENAGRNAETGPKMSDDPDGNTTEKGDLPK